MFIDNYDRLIINISVSIQFIPIYTYSNYLYIIIYTITYIPIYSIEIRIEHKFNEQLLFINLVFSHFENCSRKLAFNLFLIEILNKNKYILR